MRPSFSNPSRAVGPICRARLSRRGGTARHSGPYQDNIPVLVARDRKGATFDALLPQADSASITAALTGVVTPQIISSGMAASRWPPSCAGPRSPFTPCPRGESRPPGCRTCISKTSTLITATSSNGSTASTASPPRTCPITSFAARSRSLGRQTRTAKPDQRRYRKRPIPTDTAIRAKILTSILLGSAWRSLRWSHSKKWHAPGTLAVRGGNGRRKARTRKTTSRPFWWHASHSISRSSRIMGGRETAPTRFALSCFDKLHRLL
jgi:hypothetical protein